MKRRVRGWAYIIGGKIQLCSLFDLSDTLCIHRKFIEGSKLQRVEILYELPKKKKGGK